MVSECPTKHEYYNRMAQRPRQPPLETPPQVPVQNLAQHPQDLIEWFQREASCPGCGKEHLVPDCPEKKKKISTNLLSIVPSTVGANVITRAQRIAHNLQLHDQGLPTLSRKKRKSRKNASIQRSQQTQEPEGDEETIPANPNQELPAHLAAYPNPVAEKQKVEEYIQLIRHEQFEGSLGLPSLNFDQIEEWINPPPQRTDKPRPAVMPVDTPISQPTSIKEVNTVLLQQILNLKLRLTLREVQHYTGTFVTDNPQLRPILAKEMEFTLEELLKLDIQPWHDVLRRINGGLSAGHGEKMHTHIPSTTAIPQQPNGTPIEVCEAHFESDDTSFTLPVCVNGTTCDAIIDTGAGVSIVSYECWCKWGSPKMLPSDVKLRMADGSIQRPEGMIPTHNFTIHGVEFNLTFVVTRSSNHVAYECLLGRPFLRVSRLVMDFGNDTIYMRKNNKTFRIKAYTQKVHEQEGSPLVDDWSETTEFETNLLACNPTKAVQILTRGQPLPQVPTNFRTDNAPENQSVASDASEMNWVHALATTDAMYPIGTKCHDEDGDTISCFNVTTLVPQPKQINVKDEDLTQRTTRKEEVTTTQKTPSEVDFPERFKVYEQGSRAVACKRPQRTPIMLGEACDGPARVKEINLGNRVDPKPVFIAMDLHPDEETSLIALLTEFRDVFAWSYVDMKGVPAEVVTHSIPMRTDARPIRQRPRPMNPNYAQQVKAEITKMLDAGIIYPIERTTWVSPIVVVPKKSGQIRICVDYRQVNEATIKDNYPVPYIEHLLERVAGAEAYSFIDGFSGYNQISVVPEDQHKTAFATEFGTFAYKQMPFGLTSALSTYQRAADHIFATRLRQGVESYVDDLCCHSKWHAHLALLRSTFEKCREYRLSLNPLKCQFWVKHGLILGHVVSRHGISTDEAKVKLILDMPPPTNEKQLQGFMGYAGYYRRFIKMFADKARPLYALLKQYSWTEECTRSFELLKECLTKAPILRSPDWNKEFHVHTDTSAFAIGAVLVQPGEGALDLPITFASRQLNSAEQNYSTTEREALAMVYSVKKFRHYLLASRFSFFVDHQALLYLVNKTHATGRISRWIVTLLEFDFKVVVRKGKDHVLADHFSRIPNGEEATGVDDETPDAALFAIDTIPSWASDIVRVLTEGAYFLKQLSRAQARVLLRKCGPFTMLRGNLYRKGNDDILRRCVADHDVIAVLEQAHCGNGSGHFNHEITARKVLQSGLWWPTLFKDTYEYVRRCDECQRFKHPAKADFNTLHSVVAWQPFEKWGIDFIGPISPASNLNRYIITATDYATKWAEAKACINADARSTAKFLYENVITRFGCPLEIISDQGSHFLNEVIAHLLGEFMVTHRKSSPYYPRCNGQAESTNKVLCAVLTKIIAASRSDWSIKLQAALWAFRTSYKVATHHTPFKLVYGQEAVLPIEFLVPSLRIAVQERWDGNPLPSRLENLERLTETRLLAFQALLTEKANRKAWHDNKVKDKDLAEGDMALKFTSQRHKKKLKLRGEGPYVVSEITKTGACRIRTLEGIDIPGFINGSKLKRYYGPLTLEALLITRQREVEAKLKASEGRMARLETDLRNAQAKLKRQSDTHPVAIAKLIDPNVVTTHLPCIANGIPLRAVVDTGASLTLFSFEMWEHLGSPNLEACSDNFLGFDGSISRCMGAFVCKITTQHTEHLIQVRVLPPKVLYTPCLLGLDWCHVSECLLSPSKNMVSFQTENGVKFEKLVTTTLEPSLTNLGELQSMNSRTQKELAQPPTTQVQKNTNTDTKTSARREWVNIHAIFAEGTRRGERAIWRVRKELTNAQGWHKGATHFWVPKRSRLPDRDHITTTRDTRQPHTSTKFPAQVKAIDPVRTRRLGSRSPHRITPQVWVRKGIQKPSTNTRTTHSSLSLPQPHPRALNSPKLSQISQWVPAQPHRPHTNLSPSPTLVNPPPPFAMPIANHSTRFLPRPSLPHSINTKIPFGPRINPFSLSRAFLFRF